MTIIIVTEYYEDYIDRYTNIMSFVRHKYSGAHVTAILYSKFISSNTAVIDTLFDSSWHINSIANATNIVKQVSPDVVICLLDHHHMNADNPGIFLITAVSTSKSKMYCFRNVISLQLTEFCFLLSNRKILVHVAVCIWRLLEVRLKVSLLSILFKAVYPFLLMHKSSKSKSMQKNIVIRLDFLGDMIVSLPYLSQLRTALFPAELVLLTTSKGASIVREQLAVGNKICDEIIVWNPPWHTRKSLLGFRDIISTFKILPKLIANNYEQVIQPVTIGIGVMIAVMLAGKKTVSVVDRTLSLTKTMSNYITDPIILRPKHLYHMHDYWKMILKCLYIKTSENIQGVVVSEADLAAVRQMMGVKESCKLVLLNIGAGNRLREWESQKFAELAGKLELSGHLVVLVGGEDDRKKAADILELCRLNKLTNLVGELSLNMVAAALSIADVVVTADTGIMHLAAAVKSRIVAIFGAGNVSYCSPRTDDFIIIRHELGCSGCADVCFAPTPPCIEAVTVDEVYGAVLSQMSCLGADK